MKRLFENLVERACFVIVIALSLIVFLQVINRFLLKYPMAWSEELAMLLFQWVAFLGAAVGVKRISHFGIDLLVERLSEKAQKTLGHAVPLAMAVVAVVMVTEGFRLLELTKNQMYTTMEISHAWAYAATPVSGVLMIFYLIQSEIRRRRKGKTEGGHKA
jgi:TRAP-type C4-dicarboxylate transport system permease small subunit